MENKKPLHVLVISTWYPHGKDKLIGIYHKLFCEALANNGVKVNMLHVDRQAISLAPRYPFMEKFYEEQCEGYVTYFRRMLNLSRISYDLQMKSYVKHLEQLYRRYEAQHGKPDVLHAQVTVPAGYAACVLGKKIGVPVVITEHATYFERFFGGREGKYGRIAVAQTDRLTCVGKYMTDIYADSYDLQAQVLPNIVECSAFARPKCKPDDGLLHFVSVCALRTPKRIDFAAKALKSLRDRNLLPPFRYTVVGDGAEGGYFRQAVAEMGMSDCVEFIGQKDTEQIADILSRSDILLMPSSIETFGIPAIEALAAGVPVVCTKCKGPEGFLTPECSELCEVDDPESMADAILRLYHRLPTLDETQIRAVAQQFDAASVASLAVSIYREIIKQ